MFRKLDVAKLEQTKSSVARGIRGRIAEQYPQLEDEDVLDELIPKKSVMTIAKTAEKNAVIVVDGSPLFFQLRDGPRWHGFRMSATLERAPRFHSGPPGRCCS